MPETGPAGADAAAAAGAAEVSLGAVLVSLEQALNKSSPHAATLGKTNFFMVFYLSVLKDEALLYDLSRFYVNRRKLARRPACAFAKLAGMRHLGLVCFLACRVLFAADDPFAKAAPARVLIFVRSDCPIANRYAPELNRIAREFETRGVEFWLVYPDASETAERIMHHKLEYKLPGTPVRDPKHLLQKRAQATIAPQAAVFDRTGRLLYSGRIDDRYVAFGKARSEPTTHDLESAILATLDGKPIKEPRTKSVGCYLADIQ